MRMLEAGARAIATLIAREEGTPFRVTGKEYECARAALLAMSEAEIEESVVEAGGKGIYALNAIYDATRSPSGAHHSIGNIDNCAPGYTVPWSELEQEQQAEFRDAARAAIRAALKELSKG